MIRGRPFEPGNQFGRGRPPGSRNKRSKRAQQWLEQYNYPSFWPTGVALKD